MYAAAVDQGQICGTDNLPQPITIKLNINSMYGKVLCPASAFAEDGAVGTQAKWRCIGGALPAPALPAYTLATALSAHLSLPFIRIVLLNKLTLPLLPLPHPLKLIKLTKTTCLLDVSNLAAGATAHPLRLSCPKMAGDWEAEAALDAKLLRKDWQLCQQQVQDKGVGAKLNPFMAHQDQRKPGQAAKMDKPKVLPHFYDTPMVSSSGDWL